MDIEFSHRFDAPLDRVVAMYADESFGRERADATGALESDVLVDGAPPGEFTVAIRRTVPSDAIEQRARQFIGPKVTIRYTEVWQPQLHEVCDGTFAVEILGVPARAAGSLRLAVDGDATVLTVEGSIHATVPLLSGLISDAVTRALTQGIEQELAAADAWLERR